MGAVSKKRYEKKCIVCDKSFTAKSSKGKYCSDHCRQKRFIKNSNDKLLHKNVSVATHHEKNVLLDAGIVTSTGSDDKNVFSTSEKNVSLEEKQKRFLQNAKECKGCQDRGIPSECPVCNNQVLNCYSSIHLDGQNYHVGCWRESLRDSMGHTVE